MEVPKMHLLKNEGEKQMSGYVVLVAFVLLMAIIEPERKQ
jgi:hypothetical protein